MQYISDRLMNTTHEVSDYSDMFATLKDSINKLEVVHEEKTWTTSLCLETLNSDCISLEDFKKSTMEDFEKACDLLISLRDYLEDLSIDPDEVDANEVPEELFHFFNTNKNVAFYSAITAVKRMDKKKKRNKKVKSKTKMLF